MAKKKQVEEKGGGAPAWMATYGDMVTLLLCFFVLLFSMSSVDVAKFKAAMSSFADQIDVLPGGESLTDGELLNNGISQLNDIQIVFEGAMAWNTDGRESTEPNENPDETEPNEQLDPIDEEDPFKKAAAIAEDIEAILENKGYDTTVAVSFSANYIKFTLEGDVLFDSGRANLKPEAAEAIGAIAEIANQSEYKDYDMEIDGHTDDRPINNAQFPNNWILSAYRAEAVLQEFIDVHGYDPERVAATAYGEYRPIADNDTVEGRAKNRRVEIKVLLNTDELTVEEYSIEELKDGSIDFDAPEGDGDTGTDDQPGDLTNPDEGSTEETTP